jgi:hypothetical protein
MTGLYGSGASVSQERKIDSSSPPKTGTDPNPSARTSSTSWLSENVSSEKSEYRHIPRETTAHVALLPPSAIIGAPESRSYPAHFTGAHPIAPKNIVEALSKRHLAFHVYHIVLTKVNELDAP